MAAIDLERFYPTFFAESAAGLDAMEADLLRLEKETHDVELMNAIFRAIHSIKGASSTFGFGDIANFSHSLESFLDRMRTGQLEASAGIVNILLRAVDALRALLRAAQDRATADPAQLSVNENILAELQAHGAVVVAAAPAAPVAADADTNRFRIVFAPKPGLLKTGNDPLRLLQMLARMGELTVRTDTGHLPPFAEMDPERSYLRWDLELAGAVTHAQIAEVFEWVSDDCDLLIEAQDATPAQTGAAAATAASSYAPPTGITSKAADVIAAMSNSLHVSTEKVDNLINLVGELVITQTMLRQLGENMSLDKMPALQATLAQLDRNTRELQHSVMSIRMLPASFAFNRFARMVRDTSQQLGKLVELKISGEQSELDKTVIEKLIDPLTHLIRNSLDHGIEVPAQRLAAGKPEVASIHLHAEHKGGSIVIQVGDDGHGLNRDKIRAKAIARGLVAPTAELSDDEIDRLIFLPGFSTADVVSDVSGRGVGMDVVRRNIASLGGNIEIESRPGRGINFTIRLPLTLAIVDGMSIALGAQTYILPLTFIVESIQPRAESLRSIAGAGRVLEVRGEYVPVVDMHTLFNEPSVAGADAGILVLIEAEGKKVALLVDALLGQDQVVIKSLEANYRKVPFISGATILGDGRVALILDANALVRAT